MHPLRRPGGMTLSLIGLVFVAILPLLIFGSGVAALMIDQEKQAIAKELASTTSALRVAVERELGKQFSAMELLASDAELVQGHLDAFAATAATALKVKTDWLNVGLIDGRTHDIVAAAPHAQNLPIASVSPAGADEVIRTGRPLAVGAFTRSNITAGPIILLMVPVQVGAHIPYVLGVALDPKSVSNIFKDQGLNPSWTGAVVDAGMLLAGRSRQADDYIGKPATPTLVDQIKNRNQGMFTALDQEGDRVYTAFNRSPSTGWSVAIGVPASQVDGPIQRLLLQLMLAGGGLIATALVFTGLAGRAIVRRRAADERALRQSQVEVEKGLRDFRDLVSQVPMGVAKFRLLAQGGVHYDFVSTRWCEQRGAPADASCRDPAVAFQYFDEDDRQAFLQAHEAARESLVKVVWEVRLIGPLDGRWLHGESSPAVLSNGDVLFSAIEQDITEHKRTRDQLRKLSTAVEQSPACVVITDLDATIEYVNPRFSEVTGHAAVDVIGQNPRIFQSGETPAHTYVEMWATLTGGAAWKGELVNRRKNGQIYWEESQIAPVFGPSGQVTHYVAVKTDITARKHAEIALRHSQHELLAVQHLAQIGTWSWDIDHNVHTWSDEIFAIYGRDTALGPANFPEVRSYFSAQSWEQIEDAVRRCLATGTAYQCDAEVVRPTGGHRWITVFGEAVVDPGGNVTHLRGLVQDITERRQAADRLQKSEVTFRKVLEGAADAIFITDLAGRYTYVNQAATQLLGFSRDELLAKSISDITPAQDLPEVMHAFLDLVSSGSLRRELRLKRKDASVVPVDFNGTLLVDDAVFGSCRDITERKTMEEAVQRLAFHDALTNLPNRRLLDDRLHQVMASNKRTGSHGAVIFLDLDNFKVLNDSYGHAVGDQLLVTVAQRLQTCVRDTDTVARFGGDEFVVLLSMLDVDRMNATHQARAVANKIRTLLATPYSLNIANRKDGASTLTHQCTASIGGAIFFDREFSAGDILKWADTAMYQAKWAGKDSVRIHDSGDLPNT